MNKQPDEQAELRGMTKIALRPATLSTDDNDVFDSLILDGVPRSLMALMTEDENVAAKAECIQKTCMDLKEMANISGVHEKVLTNIRMVLDLHPAYIALIKLGRISRSVALKLARMTTSEQDKLLQVLGEHGGKLTMDDLHGVRSAVKSQIAAKMNPSLFEEELVDTKEEVRQALRTICTKYNMSVDELADFCGEQVIFTDEEILRPPKMVMA